MTIYTGHSVVFQNDADASATIVGGITSMDVPIDTEINAEETAGSPYAQNSTVKSQKPKFTFTTRDAVKVLALLGLTGRAVIGATNDGAAMWLAQLDNGVIKTGSSHKKIRVASGRANITQISVNHQEDVGVDVQIAPIWDKTNNPIIPSASSLALPGTPLDPARHTLGPFTIGALAFDCVQSLNINFGLSLDMFGGDSDPWDSALAIAKLQPEITFTTLRANAFVESGGVSLIGLAGTHANTKIYLRKRLNGGTSAFVADGTAEHIKLTIAGILTIDNAFNSSQNKRGEIRFKITPRFDGTNLPIVINTASAIT